MKKLSMVAGIVAVATVGFAVRARAQTFYPGTTTSGVPGRVSGAYGYPSQYPTYPGQYPQYPAASHERRDKDRHDRKRGRAESSRYDRDRDDQWSGYGSRTTSSAPSRVGGYAVNAREASRGRDGRFRDTSRDRR